MVMLGSFNWSLVKGLEQKMSRKLSVSSLAPAETATTKNTKHIILSIESPSHCT